MVREMFTFLNDRFREVSKWLRGVSEGFDPSAQTFGGGGINEVNAKLESVKTKLDTLNTSVRADDPNIASTKTNTDTIVSKVTSIDSRLSSMADVLTDIRRYVSK